VNIKVGDPELELRNATAPPTASMPDEFIEGRRPHRAKLNRDNDGRAGNWQLASTLLWELPFASVKSITGFQDHSLFATYDADGTARDLLFFPYRKDFSRALTQEITLVGTTEWFTWLLGTHFLHEKFGSTWDPIEIPEFGFGSGALIGVIGREDVKSASAFADATVFLPKGFSLFGGLRFTHDEKKLDQDDSFRLASAPDVRLPIEGVDCRQAFKDKFDDVSPRYGIKWDGERVNVYAKRSFGYNAGGHYPFACNNAYEDETLDQIETGVKSSWFGGRLVANASVFRSDFKNFQIFKVIGAGAKIINAPKARMRGAEFEAAALPM
jgi:iron complex outermembrane receptor protein